MVNFLSVDINVWSSPESTQAGAVAQARLQRRRFMNKVKICGLIALALIAVPLFAHHGTATSFDTKKVVTMTGLVKEFRWRNPHAELVLDGKDDAGQAMSYSIEMGAPAQLAMDGLTRNTFRPGDEVVIEVHPSFSSPSVGENGGKIWINGKEFHRAERGN